MADRIKEREDRWRAEAANGLLASIREMTRLEDELVTGKEPSPEWAQSWLMAYTKRARAIVKLEGLFRP